MSISGSGRASFQPIRAEDVADCVMAVLERHPHRPAFELAGPEVLSYDEFVATVLRSVRRRRRLVHVPLPVVRVSLRALEGVLGPATFVTWEEAELMEEPMVIERGTADAEALGVTPLAMREVLESRGPRERGPQPATSN